ncbi:MAG: ribonuclease R, partial [Chitinophagaceae bacterium]|nr:ribonuclease R [Chitinophagaceae bacterium]
MTRLMSPKKHTKKRRPGNSGDRFVTGVLDVSRAGMGFIITPDAPEDILVRPADFNTALHGDTVRALLNDDHKKRGRQQGAIVEVLKRKQLEFPGKLQLSANFAFFIADTDKAMPDIFVPIDKTMNATENDTVVVRITEWQKNKKPVGEVIQIMDASDESDLAMKQILMENGFSLAFGDEALEEAARIPELISREEIGR